MPKQSQKIQQKTGQLLNIESFLNLPDFNFSKEDIASFKKLSVIGIILFGSRALGLAHKGSDFDFGIILKNPSPLFIFDYNKRQEIYDELYNIFSSRIGQLLNIDIVFLQKAPAELRSHVARRGLVLYERHPGVFADFKETVINQYADFEAERNIFHKAILARIQ